LGENFDFTVNSEIILISQGIITIFLFLTISLLCAIISVGALKIFESIFSSCLQNT